MKFYDCKKIKEIIESRKNDVVSAECGMDEDWSWTAEPIYENGKYTIDLSDKTVLIAGIDGSYWATPTMRLHLKNGDVLMFDVYFSDEG